MKKYFSLLDPLRLVAAAWVMNYHYLFAQETDNTLHWYRYGNLGVQIFFVISGFVIVQSIEHKSFKEFATGRFLRLFPLFWVLCTITYLLTIVLPDTSYTIHFTDYVRSMTMLSDLLDKILGPSTLVDASYWTLAVEVVFYAGVAFFVHVFGHKNLQYFFASLLAVSAAVFAMHLDSDYYAKLLLVRHAAYFVFGGTLALIATSDKSSVRQTTINYSLLIFSAVYATAMHAWTLPAYQADNVLDSTIVALIHIAIFVGIPLFVFLSRFITHHRTIEILAIFGAITYPLYLLHQRIGNMLIDYFIKHTAVRWVSLVIIMQIAMILLAYTVSVIDSKARRYVRGYVRGNVREKKIQAPQQNNAYTLQPQAVLEKVTNS